MDGETSHAPGIVDRTFPLGTSDHVASSSELTQKMEQPKSRPQRFYGYPRPIEAPHIPFTKSEDSNPVFSGFVLMVGAWLYVTSCPLGPEHCADLKQCFQTRLRPEVSMEKCWI